MTEKLAPGCHPDILTDGNEVRAGIVDEHAPGNPGTFTDMHSPEPMNGRRDVCRKSKRGDDRPKSDPDALDDRPESSVIVCHWEKKCTVKNFV